MPIPCLISHAQNPFLTGCNSERTAAGLLGYTQASWDDSGSGKDKPSSEDKYFAELTHEERVAAVTLGFKAKTWDDESGKEKQPASEDKFWAELATCGSCDSTLCTDNSLA